MIAYRAMLDVPRELVTYVSRLLATQRRTRGTRRGTRALTCWRQALFALVWLRKREDLTILGASFGISRATAYRYRDEALDVLANQAPELSDALARVADDGWAFVILDGKLVAADRCAATTISRKGQEIDLWYSGKAHRIGGNIQAVMRPDGMPIWNPARCTTWSPRTNTPWAHCTPPQPEAFPPWPTAATKAQATGYTPRTSNPPTATSSPPTTAPTTCCCAHYAASANAGSPS